MSSEKRIRTPSLKSAEAAMDKRLKDEKDSSARIAQRSPAGKSPAAGLAACPECASSKCGAYFCSKKVYIDHGLPFMLEVTVADDGQDVFALN